MAADNLQQDTSQFTKIYTLAIPAGIKRDGTAFETNEYTDGVWCRFQRGVPKKMGGYRTLFTSSVGIYRGLVSQPYNGVNYIFAGNYQELDVFATGINYGVGSGPFPVNMLPGTSQFTLVSHTSSSFTIAGNVTALFPTGTNVIFNQTTPVNYVTTTATYSSPNTTVNITGTISGSPTNVWLNNTPVFTADPKNGPYRITWQFDAQFSPAGGQLSLFSHPGYNLIDIDNGVPSQVLVGNIVPTNTNSWYFSGLSDSAGQNPTYQPISVDGGVCVLYPFIFVYGSHGYIANNNVTTGSYGTQSFYDWNGLLANQINVASSKIVKGMPMRGGTNSPAGLFWATDSLIRVSFNTGNTTNGLYWIYDIISSQISIMSSNAVVEMDGIYWWMGVDRFYAYNGGVTVIPNDKNVNYLFDNINYQQRQKVWATKIPRYNEIWFFYPRGTATECTDAIIYNTKDKIWYDAGQAVGAQRSCGYTTELFPTPIWADWNYTPNYSSAFSVINNPASLPAPSINQIYLAGDQTSAFSPGSVLSFSNTTGFNSTYIVTSSVLTYNTTIGTPGVTLVTFKGSPGVSPIAGTLVYKITGGFSIWQHEFGQNEITLTNENAIYSSFTTSNIDWITGSPGKTPNPLTPAGSQLVGMNRRMHLRRVEPNFLQTGTMGMTILGRKFANGSATDATTSGPYYFDPSTDKIDLRVEDRLVQLKFESNTINGNYEMGRLMITAELGDERP
jgi:hypothetical protein